MHMQRTLRRGYKNKRPRQLCNYKRGRGRGNGEKPTRHLMPSPCQRTPATAAAAAAATWCRRLHWATSGSLSQPPPPTLPLKQTVRRVLPANVNAKCERTFGKQVRTNCPEGRRHVAGSQARRGDKGRVVRGQRGEGRGAGGQLGLMGRWITGRSG